MTRHRLLQLVTLSRTLAAALTAALSVITLTPACGSRANPVGPGGECFLATDCAPGLVCVEQSNKTRLCSDDLTRVAGRNPPEAGAEEADAASDASSADGSTPETSVPRQDSGNVPDVTQPPPDTGAPPVDSGGD